MGVDTDVDTGFVYVNLPNHPQWLGLHLEFPRGNNTEAEGFGQCYKYLKSDGKVTLATTYRITLRFPANCEYTVTDVPESLRSRFAPSAKMAALRVRFPSNARAIIEGFGMPFSNPGHPADGWINRGDIMIQDMTLVDFLQQQSFHLVIDKAYADWLSRLLPRCPVAEYSYPYGDEHFYSMQRYLDMQQVMKGERFEPRWSFDNDNEHVAVTTQSTIQDILWVAQAAAEIFSIKLPAYFVPQTSGEGTPTSFYTIMTLPGTFHAKYDDAWKRLTSRESIQLSFHEDYADIQPPLIDTVGEWKRASPKSPLWLAKIMEHHFHIPQLKEHNLGELDLVLLVRAGEVWPKELRKFSDCSSADAALAESVENWNPVSLVLDPQLSDTVRKIDAVWELREGARPTNPEVCGMPSPEAPVPDNVAYKMKLQRALLRGAGFYTTLVEQPSASADTSVDAWAGTMASSDIRDSSRLPKRLPIVNFLYLSPVYLNALVEEVLLDDCDRFVRYMSQRPLGLGIVTAPPGFGKTSLMATTTIGMAHTFGKIYASAPTNVAVDNFAYRLEKIDTRFVQRLNKDKAANATDRAHRRFIVRAYKLDHEIIAFRRLLEDPKLGDKASPSGFWFPNSKWKLHCSLTYWFLMILGSPAVRPIDDDDSPALYQLCAQIEGNQDLRGLRMLVAGQLQWSQIKDDEANSDKIMSQLFEGLLDYADIVCSTPSMASRGICGTWRNRHARAISVDEAANMNRADLYAVWGNTLLPLLLGGDDKQLQPTVMSEHAVDGEGRYHLRHYEEARMSPLLWFKMSGIPVYRLTTQFRMANDLFGLSHNEVYRDLPFQYGPRSDISLPDHQLGRQLEAYMRAKYPELSPPADNTLAPIFVHCEHTFCHVDLATGSKSNRKQVKVAMDFLVDLVGQGIPASKMVVICPYKANVEIIASMRKRMPKYEVLEPMPAAATVDSFQGQEGDIVVVVMGTTAAVGPGFTRDENRLNVMLSRQRSGLIIFGDITVGGKFIQTKAKSESDKKWEKKERSGRVGHYEDGKQCWLRAAMLRNVYNTLASRGRVVTVVEEEEMEKK